MIIIICDVFTIVLKRAQINIHIHIHFVRGHYMMTASVCVCTSIFVCYFFSSTLALLLFHLVFFFCAVVFHGIGLVMTTFIYFWGFGTEWYTNKSTYKAHAGTLSVCKFTSLILSLSHSHFLCMCVWVVYIISISDSTYKRKNKLFVFGIASELEKNLNWIEYDGFLFNLCSLIHSTYTLVKMYESIIPKYIWENIHIYSREYAQFHELNAIA